MSERTDPPALRTETDIATADRWDALRRFTPARIGLGRVGTAMPMRSVLDLQYAHALARDAVHAPLNVAALVRDLQPLPTLSVASNAPDRATYLRRPDLGRVLDPESHKECEGLERPDIVFVVADGLSATGVQTHAAPLVHACVAELSVYRIGPVVVATQGRVALGDDIAARLGARLCVMVIGERPGLTVSDSVGIYLTFDPKPGRHDSERNCISNIHPNGGLSAAQAARKLGWLASEALCRQVSGVGLKDDMPVSFQAQIEPPGSPPMQDAIQKQ